MDLADYNREYRREMKRAVALKENKESSIQTLKSLVYNLQSNMTKEEFLLTKSAMETCIKTIENK